MTLSGSKDSDEARRRSREARQQREEGYAAKRPWQMPLIVTIAVFVLVVAVGIGIVFGGKF